MELPRWSGIWSARCVRGRGKRGGVLTGGVERQFRPVGREIGALAPDGDALQDSHRPRCRAEVFQARHHLDETRAIDEADFAAKALVRTVAEMDVLFQRSIELECRGVRELVRVFARTRLSNLSGSSIIKASIIILALTKRHTTASPR